MQSEGDIDSVTSEDEIPLERVHNTRGSSAGSTTGTQSEGDVDSITSEDKSALGRRCDSSEQRSGNSSESLLSGLPQDDRAEYFEDEDLNFGLEIAHYSVKEYLVSTRIRSSQERCFSLEPEVSHARLAHTCLTYLMHFSLAEPYVPEEPDRFPLVPYAERHWGYHYGLSADQFQLTEKALDFLNSHMWGFIIGTIGFYCTPSLGLSPALLYPAWLGIPRLVSALLDRNPHCMEVAESAMPLMTPLAAAVLQGHESVVDLLIRRGARIDESVVSNPGPDHVRLDRLSRRRRQFGGIVLALVKAGLPADAAAHFCYRTIKSCGLVSRKLENDTVFQALVSLLRDGKISRKSKNDLLLQFADLDVEPAIRALVNAGADLSHTDSFGRTAFIRNLRGGHRRTSLWAILIGDRGVSWTDSAGRTPLHLLSHVLLDKIQERAHFPKAVDWLITHGVPLDKQCTFAGNTAALQAAKVDNMGLVRCLLANKCDIHISDFEGNNLLMIVASSKHLRRGELLDYLVKNGADIYAENSAGWTMLDMAFLTFLELADTTNVRHLLRLFECYEVDLEALHGLVQSSATNAASKFHNSSPPAQSDSSSDSNSFILLGTLGMFNGDQIDMTQPRAFLDDTMKIASPKDPHWRGWRQQIWACALFVACMTMTWAEIQQMLSSASSFDADKRHIGLAAAALAFRGSSQVAERVLDYSPRFPFYSLSCQLYTGPLRIEQRMQSWYTPRMDLGPWEALFHTYVKKCSDAGAPYVWPFASRLSSRLRADVIDALLTKGADADMTWEQSGFGDYRNKWYHLENNCMLHHVTKEGDMAALRVLLSHGAMVDKVIGFPSASALENAASRNDCRMVKALIDARADVNAEVNRGAIFAAAFSWPGPGRLGALTLLEEAGANLDVQDDKGTTPLHHACRLGHDAAIVEYLIAKEADQTVQDGMGLTPLLVAARNGQQEVMRVLLEKGSASLNSADRRGNGLLHHAASAGQLETVQWLIDRGINRNMTNLEGLTAFGLVRRLLGQVFKFPRLHEHLRFSSWLSPYGRCERWKLQEVAAYLSFVNAVK